MEDSPESASGYFSPAAAFIRRIAEKPGLQFTEIKLFVCQHLGTAAAVGFRFSICLQIHRRLAPSRLLHHFVGQIDQKGTTSKRYGPAAELQKEFRLGVVERKSGWIRVNPPRLRSPVPPQGENNNMNKLKKLVGKHGLSLVATAVIGVTSASAAAFSEGHMEATTTTGFSASVDAWSGYCYVAFSWAGNSEWKDTYKDWYDLASGTWKSTLIRHTQASSYAEEKYWDPDQVSWGGLSTSIITPNWGWQWYHAYSYVNW